MTSSSDLDAEFRALTFFNGPPAQQPVADVLGRAACCTVTLVVELTVGTHTHERCVTFDSQHLVLVDEPATETQNPRTDVRLTVAPTALLRYGIGEATTAELARGARFLGSYGGIRFWYGLLDIARRRRWTVPFGIDPSQHDLARLVLADAEQPAVGGTR